MQPLIEMIKKFAIQEKKSELKMICKIAVQLFYHSNRKICLIFQKIGEDPQEFVSKFKSIVTMMKYSKKSSDKTLVVPDRITVIRATTLQMFSAGL